MGSSGVRQQKCPRTGRGINLLWMPIRWRKDLRVFLPGNLSSKYIKMIRWKVLDLPERTALESFSQERSSLVDFSPRKVGMSTGNSDHRTLPPKANTQSAILEDATVDPHQSEVSGYPKGKGVSFRNIARQCLQFIQPLHTNTHT